MNRSAALGLILTSLALPGCGGGDEKSSGSDAFSAVETQVAAQRREQAEHAAPRWEPLASLHGSADSSTSVTVADEALQWRARWHCSAGAFELTANGRRFADDACPGDGGKPSIDTGQIELAVGASAPWRLTVEQQVDSPLHERPLPEMNPGAELARGSFYKVERRGKGNAILYRLPDGRLALRFEGFQTAANTQLFVWLTSAPRPRTTEQVLAAPHVQIGLLKSTLGDQNYILPAGFDEASARSVAIWCKPIQIAYAAAALPG
ncbi:MAG: DM13 domain-containing protein [Solirubrobacterales bacterium]